MVLETAFPFPVMAPISSNVLFWIPLPEIFHLVRSPNWQSVIILVLGVTHFVPFQVLGYAISGTVFPLAPYRKWTLCAMRVVSFPVSGSAISGIIHWAPYRKWTLCVFLVSGSASSGTVVVRVLCQNWTLCVWTHFQYWAMPVPVRLRLGSSINVVSKPRPPNRSTASWQASITLLGALVLVELESMPPPFLLLPLPIIKLLNKLPLILLCTIRINEGLFDCHVLPQQGRDGATGSGPVLLLPLLPPPPPTRPADWACFYQDWCLSAWLNEASLSTRSDADTGSSGGSLLLVSCLK